MQSDERLSTLFAKGVDPAFDELVRRYRGPLILFAGGIVGRDRAEDVVQESLVKAHRSMTEGDICEPKAWLYKVVRNTALNEIRDGAKHEHAELDDRGAGSAPDQAAEEAERREELAMLISALAELPESQRTALVGRELGGYTHDELAAKLGVSRGATKQLIFRARTGLRNALGALFPVPLIVWLASDTSGTFVASGAGSVTAAGVAGVAGGTGGAAGGAAGVTGAAAGGGLFAGLAGGGAAKVAVVAAVAGGTVAAGVAVEEKRASEPETRPAVVRSFDSSGSATNTGGVTPALDGSLGAAGGSSATSGPERRAGQGNEESARGADAGAPAGTDHEGPGVPGGGHEEVAAVDELPGSSGKGLGGRPGAGKPWKEAGFEKPWKATGGEKPWKSSGAEKPWKATGSEKPWKGLGSGKTGSGQSGSGGGSNGRPFGGSGGGSAPVRPARPARPSSSGSGANAQSSPSTEAPSSRPSSGRLGAGKRARAD